MSEPQAVLIVDDEPHIQLLLEQTLEELVDDGVEVLLASNGADALALIEAHRPSMVLLDVMMPVMNGFELCRRIKADPELRDTYVLMLTAKGQAADREAGAEAGADAYLTKPFDPDDVLERVSAQLGMAGR